MVWYSFSPVFKSFFHDTKKPENEISEWSNECTAKLKNARFVTPFRVKVKKNNQKLYIVHVILSCIFKIHGLYPLTLFI